MMDDMDDDNTTIKGAEAGVGHGTVHMASASISADLSGELARNNMIISDVSQPHLDGRPKTPRPHQSRHQNLFREWKVQEPVTTTSTSISSLPPTSRLAVHIRSSASPSHAQQGINTAMRDEELRHEQIIVGKEASVTLPFVQDEADESSIQPKKRGRPKGWKPGMSYANAKGDAEVHVKSNEPKDPADNFREPKRRGRPPRATAASARERYLQSNPDYAPFLCEWKLPSQKSCPAELQNMKTLRKHVYIVHGDADPLVCRWGKCAARDTPIEFAEQAEFEEHMNKKHFRSYVWYAGEGHQNDGISRLERDADKLPAYLFDEKGNQVTPSIAGQKFEDDRQYKERKRKLRQLLIQKDENAPSEEEWTRQTLGMA
ncbi:hypothetical protein F4820DRAFT_402932 [Hypoxylon rubiginosum]|uniref:Uncharacterized protein n=1 Tax=Hypoxylon rubiginosum TaxID=110542 RepID=A0ACB9ZFQ5_9PEZI|nr:hypothetical protein F4820DRAFT_402932 [Hypoxylon rubiginosum]